MAFYDPSGDGAKSRFFVYALSTCVHCRAAKKLLDSLGVPYDQVEVDLLSQERMDECLEELSQYNPAQSFPTIIAGSRVIVGNHEKDIRQAARKMGLGK